MCRLSRGLLTFISGKRYQLTHAVGGVGGGGGNRDGAGLEEEEIMAILDGCGRLV